MLISYEHEMHPYTTTPVQFCYHMHGCVLVLGLDILVIFSFEQN